MTVTRDRILAIDAALRPVGGVSLAELGAQLGMDARAAQGLLDFMAFRLGAPLLETGGRFRYDPAFAGVYELPHLWLTASEVFDLRVARDLVENASEVSASPNAAAAIAAIDAALAEGGYTAEVMRERFDIKPFVDPVRHPPAFERAGQAVLARRCLRFQYTHPVTGVVTERTTQPHRLIFYRQLWFMLAWCTWRNEMRAFHLANMTQLEVQQDCFPAMPEEELEEFFSQGYGKLLLPSEKVARLRFAAKAVHRIRHEMWHKNQRIEPEPDGTVIVEVPYVDVGDILAEALRYGPNVEVIWPDELRERLRKRALAIAAMYPHAPQEA